MNDTDTQAQEDQDLILSIDTLDDFVHLLTCWHQARIRELEALLNIPEGVEVGLDDGPPIMLEGNTRLAFLIGVQVALMKLGTLPFQAEVEDETSVN